jgi:hypothetical protein
MRGKVTCQLIGGPYATEELVLSALACRDTIALEGDAWYQQSENGDVNIVKGSNHRADPQWMSYKRSIYQKQCPSVSGGVPVQ